MAPVRGQSGHGDEHSAHGAPRYSTPASGGAAAGGVSGAGGGEGRRLNLLLSWGGWQSDNVTSRLPALLEPMGVHSVNARTARQAERVIRSGPVHIAVVDLGLPLDESEDPARAEEGGTRILELLRRLDQPPPTVVIKGPRSRRDESRHIAAALRCDAFAVIDRTAADIESMLRILQRALQRFYQGQWPSGHWPTDHPPSTV